MTSAEDLALRPFSKGFDWGRVYFHHCRKGMDQSAAAHMADEAQRRHARKNGYRTRSKPWPRYR